MVWWPIALEITEFSWKEFKQIAFRRTSDELSSIDFVLFDLQVLALNHVQEVGGLGLGIQ